MASTTAQVGNIRVTTQVIHNTDTVGLDALQPTTILTPATSKYFKKIPVKALSAILFLIGILQLCMGIIFYAAESIIVSLTLKSGVYIWGGVVVFVAGAACLAAILKDTINMIKVCMIFNFTNIVVAAAGLILFAVQIYYETQSCWAYESDKDRGTCADDSHKPYYSYYSASDMIKNLRVSMNVMILLFSLLGLVISCFMTIVSNKVLKTVGYSLLK